MNIKTAISAATLAAALVLPAHAANASEPPTVVVSYADLNLGSKEGQAVLDRRIKRAVNKVCGDRPGPSHLRMQVLACKRQSMAQVKPARDLAIANFNDSRFAEVSDSQQIRFAIAFE